MIPMEIKVMHQVMEWNEDVSDEVKSTLAAHKVCMINVLGSPGAGKTSTIVSLIERLRSRFRIGVIEGDITGQIDAELSKYPGVSFLGILNFGGFRLNLICVDESYEDESGNDTAYFPVTSAMVTAPGCGHMMYGRITQIDYGTTEYTDHTGIRIPKFTLDQPNDIRKLRVAARPIAVPKNYCPYIYAANVVG